MLLYLITQLHLPQAGHHSITELVLMYGLKQLVLHLEVQPAQELTVKRGLLMVQIHFIGWFLHKLPFLQMGKLDFIQKELLLPQILLEN